MSVKEFVLVARPQRAIEYYVISTRMAHSKSDHAYLQMADPPGHHSASDVTTVAREGEDERAWRRADQLDERALRGEEVTKEGGEGDDRCEDMR